MKLKILLCCTIILLLQSPVFSQTNPLISYLPDDVSTVIHIDIKRLGGKIPGEKFRQSFMYRELMKDPQFPLRSFFMSPEKSGIDLSAGILVAIKNEGKDGQLDPGIHIFGKLQNAALFTASMKELVKDDGVSIDVYGTDRIISGDGKMTAGWNNDVFVITSGHSGEIKQAMLNRFNTDDTTTREPVDIKKMMEELKISQRDLCFQLLTPKPQNNFSTNTIFTGLMSSEADMKTWTSGAVNPVSEKIIPFAGLLSKLQAMSGKNRTAVINFENGKIVMQSRNFPGDAVANLYKKYPPLSSNTDLVRRLPEGKLLALMNMSYNGEMSRELLQQTGLMELIEGFKKELPFDISLVNGVFKSNMMLAVLKSDLTTITDPITSKLEGIQLIIALPVADKAKFEKLKPAILPAWNKMKSAKETLFKEVTPFAAYNDELLVLSLSPATANAFLNNPGTREVPQWMTAYSQSPMLININMQQIMTMAMGKNSPEKNMGLYEKKLLTTFDQLIIYGGQYENESINSTMEFRFSNQTDNALSQLFEMMGSLMEKKEIMMDEHEDTKDDGTIKKQEVTLVEIKKEEPGTPPPPPPPAKPPKGVKRMPVKKIKE